MAKLGRVNRVTKWHRLAGLSLTDAFTGLLTVTQELELGQSTQRLDLVAVRTTPGPIPPATLATLPAGLDILGEHNLASFKSSQESFVTLDVLELIGYAVAYAKQNWRKQWKSAFLAGRLRLFAISVQRPQWLSDFVTTMHSREPGVYDLTVLDNSIRLIVPRETELTARNSLWHLLSGVAERVEFGLQHYQVRDTSLYSAIAELCRLYGFEGGEMSYTKADYIREKMEELTPEERLAGLSLEQRLAGLSSEEKEELLRVLQKRSGDKPRSRRSKNPASKIS